MTLRLFWNSIAKRGLTQVIESPQGEAGDTDLPIDFEDNLAGISQSLEDQLDEMLAQINDSLSGEDLIRMQTHVGQLTCTLAAVRSVMHSCHSARRRRQA